MRRGILGCGLVAVLVVALLVPGVAVAAPGNDDFAERTALAGPLPISVAGSNAEATKQVGEDLGHYAAAGHSVWYSWTAPSSSWVTVGACEGDFTALVAVYTGSELGSLTKVVQGYGSQGPGCSPGRHEFTFRAEAGTAYAIAVDANSFAPPGAPPPPLKGAFTLRLITTPTPANDDFAAAQPVSTTFQERSEGQDFYFGAASGHNAGATKETGEPLHLGGPNDASVWFRWTPPVAGRARIGVCCTPELGMTMYTGSGLGGLSPLFGWMAPAITAIEPTVSAGTTYYIAVYGRNDSDVTKVGSFEMLVRLFSTAPPLKGLKPIGSDRKRPRTRLGKRSVKPEQRKATFRFSSNEAGSRFRCKLDRKPFRACRSPKALSNLSAGRHVFKVVAVDAAGNVDKTPAVARFRIGD